MCSFLCSHSSSRSFDVPNHLAFFHTESLSWANGPVVMHVFTCGSYEKCKPCGSGDSHLRSDAFFTALSEGPWGVSLALPGSFHPISTSSKYCLSSSDPLISPLLIHLPDPDSMDKYYTFVPWHRTKALTELTDATAGLPSSDDSVGYKQIDSTLLLLSFLTLLHLPSDPPYLYELELLFVLFWFTYSSSFDSLHRPWLLGWGGFAPPPPHRQIIYVWAWHRTKTLTDVIGATARLSSSDASIDSIIKYIIFYCFWALLLCCILLQIHHISTSSTYYLSLCDSLLCPLLIHSADPDFWGGGFCPPPPRPPSTDDIRLGRETERKTWQM